ncbi:molybdenum cofactor sulfurase [Mesorhizobium sp. Root157]|uniref:MOSC domain-containing protein n=1 Tax=Mesorhizobium sp. Root157 TaxID=1736477 RepID=UPI0006F96295|nr:MOSC domain-containing protein [Mesorhizobium sp. Root157]KQZ87131.1 molybdenum cofactor sulfurase [Mesorhizobium sp. Root157]
MQNSVSIKASPAKIVVDALFIGKLAPLGPRNVPSGIGKTKADGPQRITRIGLQGDHQGDTRHHGGPEKALHHYPRDHYPAWLADGIKASAPAFGENISTQGMTEADICIGDIYRLGTAVLQVSQGRQPCWRLNARFERQDMAYLVQKSGRTGWYYRVLEEGSSEAGDCLRLEQRPAPQWPLSRVIDLLYTRTLDMDALQSLVDLPQLALSWRELAARRIATRTVEDWDRRLRDSHRQ